MPRSLPTVRIAHKGGGFRVINERDFDPKQHTLYEEPAPETSDEKPAPKKSTSKKSTSKKSSKKSPPQKGEETTNSTPAE